MKQDITSEAEKMQGGTTVIEGEGLINLKTQWKGIKIQVLRGNLTEETDKRRSHRPMNDASEGKMEQMEQKNIQRQKKIPLNLWKT